MISIVVGLGFGDEGKGVVTANLVKEAYNPMVVRFNGGHQAGHTVVKDGHRHVFSSFGSGTLHGAPTYWSHFCTVYPHALLTEYKLLKGFNPVLYIDPMCPITTPLDVFENQVFNNAHGSVGVGFGKTIERQENHYTLYAKDLKYKEVLKLKLKAIQKYYGSVTDNSILDFMTDVEEMLSIVKVGRPKHYGDWIYEGAQGIMLDQRFGFFPHVTRSNTTSQNALELIGKTTEAINTYLVTRAYQTRHGNGPMIGEDVPIIVNNAGETNVFNGYQGNFRVAPLNGELINYAIECEEQISQYPKTIVMTCCDQVEKIPDIDLGYPIMYNGSAEGNFI